MQNGDVLLVRKGLKQFAFRAVGIAKQPQRLVGMCRHHHVIEQPRDAIGHFHQHPVGPSDNGFDSGIKNSFELAVSHQGVRHRSGCRREPCSSPAGS